ncbi:hypothetical protein EZV62_003368 [Acer yangbiense]|uniref:NAC domain-containing protein n=1 Tax=Acer yangbiense TaxID=1000413 RepID=A0A5C7IGQ2_9ROSI|nr:hypothetical protein EZV62_003368 [Acer yangbiense]
MAERRLEFVREKGVMRLPPGFRFQPTDEELVFQYLKCKIFSCPLPATVIPHINICRYDPWDLPAGNMEQERGKPPHESRTDWIMHEYRLVNVSRTTPSNSNLMENWVICRIFLKKRSMREYGDHNGVVDDQPSRLHNFMTRDNNIRLSPEISSCSSSSSSSDTYQ